MNKKSNEWPVMFFGKQQTFENWLQISHDTSQGVWLQIAKKDSGIVSISYNEALESALCYGWIDSQKEKFDEKMWLQRFTPRRTKSIWSKVNREKAELLITNGRMKPSGFKAIETAKQSGQWDNAYESQSTASLPEDFANELEHNIKAKEFYNTLDRQNKYAIIFRIHSAKKPDTRAKRILQFVNMLEKGEKIYP